MEFVAGQVVGEFKLLEEAGAGGFSVVWRAERLPQDSNANAEPDEDALGPRAPREVVALKLPRVERFVDHLRKEVDLAQKVDVKRVATVLESHLEHDPPYVVLPWIEGTAFPEPERVEPAEIVTGLELMRDLAHTLVELHAGGLVHGDLKPTNLRVDLEGRVHVLDLGLGRLQMEVNLERSLAASLVSVQGESIAGTLDYMAPELFEGADPSASTDAFAFGVILHRVLTGRPPAFGVDPREVNPYLPPGTEDLLRGLLQPKPFRRFVDFEAVGRWLDRLVARERRCLARSNGHQRRRVFLARMSVLRRGLRALVVGLSLPVIFYGLLRAVAVVDRLAGGQEVLVVPVAIACAVLGFVGWIMAVTTINAWVLGVPEGLYKERPGHPLWSFMMQ